MCRAEAPHLSELQEKHRGDGLVVLGVNIDNDKPDRIRRFMDSKGLSYRMLVRGDGVAMRDYHCRAFPTLYWIDKNGTVMARDYGPQGRKRLEDRARTLIER